MGSMFNFGGISIAGEVEIDGKTYYGDGKKLYESKADRDAGRNSTKTTEQLCDDLNRRNR